MRIAIRILIIASFLGTVAWSIVAPGFDSILAASATLAGFLGTFAGHSESSSSGSSNLSAGAKSLLNEVDSCSKSKSKGLTLMMAESVTGFYVPFLWNNSLHGSVAGDIEDISDIISFAGELDNAGHLERIDAGGALVQWRRK